MDLDLWTTSSPQGEWLLIPGGSGSPPVARAFIPSKKSEGFAGEPAIEWRGSVNASGVYAMAEKSLYFLPRSECVCEIWADAPTPEPRTFEIGTADEIAPYIGEWVSRANVSLSIRWPAHDVPMVYVWGALRDMPGEDPTDEVGVKLARNLIEKGGLELVNILYGSTLRPIAEPSTFHEFLQIFFRRALA